MEIIDTRHVRVCPHCSEKFIKLHSLKTHINYMSSLFLGHDGPPIVLPDPPIYHLTDSPYIWLGIECTELHAKIVFVVDLEAIRKLSPKLADEIHAIGDSVRTGFTENIQDPDEFPDALITLLYIAHGLVNFVTVDLHRPVQQLAALAGIFIGYSAWEHAVKYVPDWFRCFENYPQTPDLDRQFYVHFAVGHVWRAEETMENLILAMACDARGRFYMIDQKHSFPDLSKPPRLKPGYLSHSLSSESKTCCVSMLFFFVLELNLD
jgi:hypothetical protein